MNEKLFVFLEILVISIVCTLLLAIVPLSTHEPQKYYENLVIPMTTKKFVKSTKSLVTYNLHELPLPKPRNDLYDDLGFITLFQLPVKLNQKDVVYHKAEYNQNSINQLKHLIDHQYLASFEFDDLPVIFQSSKRKSDRSKFPIGFRKEHVSNNNSIAHQNGTYVLFNHMNIKVKYHENKDNEVQIFAVIIDKLESIKRRNSTGLGRKQLEILDISDVGQKKVYFSYSVHWEATLMNPNKRFDANLNKPSLKDILNDINSAYGVDNRKADQLFHFGVSLGFLFALSVAVAVALLYTTSTDNSNGQNNEGQFKWKLICRDVFRKPKHFEFRISFVGIGVQIFCALAITVIFGCCNVFADNRYTMIFYIFQWYYVMFGFVGSYCHYTIVLIYIKPPDIQHMYSLQAIVFYPFTMFTIWSYGRIFVAFHKLTFLFRFDKVFFYNLFPSCAMISLYTIFFWCMMLVGEAYANLTSKIRKPFEGSTHPSPIPLPITWIEKCIIAMLIGIMTILTLLKCHFLDFVLNYWVEKAFESCFLLVNFVISLVIFSLANVLLLLYKLNRGDYHWWWLPFENSLAVGICLFFYAKFVEMQMDTLFEIDSATSGLFCLYSLMFSITTALVYGSVGFLVCGVVMHKMYSKLNRDIHYIAVSGGFEDEQPELV